MSNRPRKASPRGARTNCVLLGWLLAAAWMAAPTATRAVDSELTPAESNPELPSSRADAKRLDTVVVTATRREQAPRLVPASLFVIDGDSLEDRGDRSLADVAPGIPGLSHSGGGLGGASPVPILRGIGGNIEFAEDNPLVALYFGETPVTHPGGNGLDSNPRLELVDLDRIEVLRGPQGTYFGVNAMGGALRFLPRRPELGLQSARVAADLSSVEHGSVGFGAQATVNAPIDEHSALRATGWGRHHAGYIDDLQRNQKDVNEGVTGGARLGYRRQPNEALTVDLTLWTQYDRTEGDGFREYADPPLTQSRAIDERHDEHWALGQLDVDLLTDHGRLVFNLAAFDRDYVQRADVTDFFSPAFGVDLPFTARNTNAVREYTQELRWMIGEDADLGGMIGLFHQGREFHFDQDFSAPGITALIPELVDLGLGDAIARTRTLTELDHTALYTSGWWRFAPDWELTGGLRAFRESRSFRAANIGAFGNDPVSIKTSDSGLTPHLALRHEWDEDAQLYVAATRGFRGGRLTDPTGSQDPACIAELAALGFDRFPIEVDADHLWNYELGGKFRLADGAAYLNAALYRIDWDDIQTLRVLQCLGLAMVTNEGKAHSQGLEIDLWAALGERWELQTSLSYTDAEFTSGLLDGLRVPGVPRFAGSATLTFALQSPGSWLELRYSRVGRSNQVFGGGPNTEIGGYGLTTLGAVRDFGSWQGAIRLHNAFDETGRVGASDHFLLSAETVLTPRTLVLSAAFEF